MAVNKIDPKVIFASTAPTQDTPAVFPNKTNGWGESRKNGGRPAIKQMNALQQETDLKILWLNENAVTPYDATIDYPNGAVTIKEGTFKIFNGTIWSNFLDKSSVGLGNVDNTSDLNKPISAAVKEKLDYFAENGAALPYKEGITYEENAVVVKDGELQQWKGGEWVQAANKGYNLDYFAEGKSYPMNAQIMLENGDIVRSTIAGNTANPNTNMVGWELANDSLNTSFTTLNKAIKRVVADRFLERVSVKDFGAIADGSLHTLQEWVNSGKFSNLTAIQMVMPFVTSLTQSIDWAVVQYCVNNSYNIFMPAGNYEFSNVVKGRHNTTPRNIGELANSVIIFGDGVKTKVSRNDMRPATRIMNVGGTSTTQASDNANLNEACFSIHSPYTEIKSMSFGKSAVGVFFGQSSEVPLNDSNLSSVAYSKLESLSFENCGTAILMLATGGNHYVNFKDIHFTGCQIDLHQRGSFWWNITKARGDANNNRNTFANMRSDRSRIGFWTECGDSNGLIGWRGESMPSVANPFPMPDGLPVDITDATLLVFTGSNQLNVVSHSFAENVTFHVYNDGYENTFAPNGFDERYVTMKQKPKEWQGRFVKISRGISIADNIYAAFPEITAAGALFLGYSVGDSQTLTNGVRVVSKDFWHQPKTNTRGSFERDFQIETGAIAANTPVAFTIWGNFDASASGMVELDIVGRCDVTGQTSTYIVKALANVYKASTRVPSRYSIHKIFASRSTGQGASDIADASQVTTSLQINPLVGQELQIVLTCPQALTSATIFVKQKVAK